MVSYQEVTANRLSRLFRLGCQCSQMIRVEIKPELLSWARERAGLEVDSLSHRFPKLAAWEEGTVRPTLKQVEDFAKATHTPVGFLFLEDPPVENVPIPDFRTIRNKAISRPSPDLLDMIYVCQQRQEWYRDYARSERISPPSFVGSASLNSGVESTAAICGMLCNLTSKNVAKFQPGLTLCGSSWDRQMKRELW